MSLQEYKDQEKERQEVGKKSREHYASLNLPGDRVKNEGPEGVRARIAAMKEELKVPNHE